MAVRLRGVDCLACMSDARQRSLIVFSGGHATRLGGLDKARLEVGGRTIIQRIVDAIDPLVSEKLALVQNGAEPFGFGIRMVADPEPHGGVLQALANGLASASNDICLVVAGDMPFVSRLIFEQALRYLEQESADLVVPEDAYGLQQMHAAYLREPVLVAVRESIACGNDRMDSYFDAVRVRRIEVDELRRLDPDQRAFTNVNTPRDLEAAQRRATPG